MRFLGLLKIRFPILFMTGVFCATLGTLNMGVFLVGETSFPVFLEIHNFFSYLLFFILFIMMIFLEMPPLSSYVRSMYFFPVSNPDVGFVLLTISLLGFCSAPLFLGGTAETLKVGLYFLFPASFFISIIVAKPFFVQTPSPIIVSSIVSNILYLVANPILGFGKGIDELRYELTMVVVGYVIVSAIFRFILLRHRNYYLDAYNRFLKKGESCTMFVKEWYSFDED